MTDKNPQDLTMRNLVPIYRRLEEIEARVTALEGRKLVIEVNSVPIAPEK